MEHFTPVKCSRRQSLTGNPRIVKDLAEAIHTSCQQWNNIRIHGTNIVKKINAIKVNESFPDGLQELCDELETDVDKMRQVVENLKLTAEQMKAIISLHRGNIKLFTTWPAEKFVHVAEQIYDSYRKELEIKQAVLENVAWDHRSSYQQAHLAAWLYDSTFGFNFRTDKTALLLETGLEEID